jgi:hypothetical protein
MNEKYLYTLLIIVKKNGDALRLIREGLTYLEIADLTNTALDEGYIEFGKEDELITTAKGDIKILELESQFKKTNKREWISPENKSKIPKLDKDFIFLPHQNEIHF